MKFVRLGFCDPMGNQKNISVMPSELPWVLAHGVSFDASAIKGFGDVTKSDLLLFPDPSTMTVLPWRPGPGRVVRFYCDIKNPDGSVFDQDGRFILRRVIEKSLSMGYSCQIGAECEFYLFKTDENGEPTKNTLDNGGYLDISPLDKAENIRREICLCLEEMGLWPETSHHEQGPGQNEIDFKFGDALTIADNLLTFKSVVKAIATRNGLFASFMPKPIMDKSGSGLHVNLSLSRNGENIFGSKDEADAHISNAFMAGILAHIREITLFLNPLANSYDRFGKFEAPKFVSWSHQNRSQLVRIPAAVGNRARMELRSPDPSLNPYYAFALIIAAGLDGIESNLSLSPAVDVDLYKADELITANLEQLPNSLDMAIELAWKSPIVREVLGENLLNKYLAIKREEAMAFSLASDKSRFYSERYFPFV